MSLFTIDTDEEIVAVEDLNVYTDAIKLALENMYKTLSLEADEEPIEGEYTDNKQYKEQNVLEVLMAAIEKIWDAIKDNLTNIYRKVVDFIRKFSESSKTLRKKVIEVKNKLDSKVIVTEKNDIHLSVGDGFASSGTVSGKDFLIVLDRHIQTFKEIDGLLTTVKGITETILTITDSLKQSSILEKLLFWSNKEKEVKNEISKTVADVKPGVIGSAAEYLFSGVYYEYSIKKAGEGALGIFNKSKDTPIAITIEPKKMELPKVEKVEHSDKAGLNTVHDKLLVFLDGYDKFTGKLTSEVKQYTNNLNKADYSVKRTLEGLKGKDKQKTRAAGDLIKTVLKDFSGSYTSILRFNSLYGKLNIQMGYMCVRYIDEHF